MTGPSHLTPGQTAQLDQLAAWLDDLVGEVGKHLPDCDASHAHLCPGPVVTDALVAAGPRCIALLAMALVRLAKEGAR